MADDNTAVKWQGPVGSYYNAYQNQTTSDDASDYSDYSSGYSSSGSSSSGSSSSGSSSSGSSWSDADDLAERAAANLSAIVGYNAQTILNAAEQTDKAYDISDTQNANMRELENRQARRNAGNDWYAEQQKEQSTANSLTRAAGNAMNGSFAQTFWDALARVNDMADAETLNNLRENLNYSDNDYWEALMSTNNSRNDMYIDTEQNLRELAADYAAQLNNLETTNTNLLGDMVDVENHTLNVPEWLQTTYFDEHVREALQPDEVQLFRPANAAQAVSAIAGTSSAPTSAAGNADYWTRLRNGYSRRSQ